MNPNRFTIGERVHYVNHVTGCEIKMLEVVAVKNDSVIAASFLDKSKTFNFTPDGRATWSSNLSIRHEPLPTAKRKAKS